MRVTLSYRDQIIKSKWLPFLVLALLVVLTLFGPVKESHAQEQEQLAHLYGTYDMYSKAPIGVIVELETPSLIEAEQLGISQTKGHINNLRQKVIKRIQEEIPKASVDLTYDTLLAGMAVSLPVTGLPRLASIEGIGAIYPDLLYTVEKHNGPIIYDPEQAQVNKPTLTGLDTVRKKWNYTGEGVTVAVVDSGVDYRHPALEHAFGTYKGWDFIDHDDTPLETLEDNPAGDPTSHGTRMAGLIAARGAVEGIAPDATLLAYRVIGPGGTGYTRHVLAGLEKAVQDGAHIISLALINQETDWALGKAIHWAQANNQVVITHHQLLTAVDPDQIVTESALNPLQAEAAPGAAQPYLSELVLEESSVYLANLRPENNTPPNSTQTPQRHELIYAGHYSLAEVQRLDLEGKMVLLRDSQLPLADFLTVLQQKGAAGAIIYLEGKGEPSRAIAGLPLPTFVLPHEEALALFKGVRQPAQAGLVQLKLIKVSAGLKPGELLPINGVTPTKQVSPDVLTPSLALLTTLPQVTMGERTDHAYIASRGTHNAVALASGATALLIQAEKESITPLSTEERINQFTRTAYQVNHPGMNNLGEALAASYPAAGRLNIYAAISQLNQDGADPDSQADIYHDSNSSHTQDPTEEDRSVNETIDEEHNQAAAHKISFDSSAATLKVEGLENGLYQIQLVLPEKADLVQLWLFDQHYNYVGALNTYLGVDQVRLPNWNGRLLDQHLPEGKYVLVAYVASEGKGTFITSDPFTYTQF